jgi:hypothetical protein
VAPATASFASTAQTLTHPSAPPVTSRPPAAAAAVAEGLIPCSHLFRLT